MSQWINRTVLAGSSVSQNGTTSHTCYFLPAKANNLLVAVVAASATFTTPPNWTLQQSAVNNAGLYVFTKVAFTNENSFTTTHNGSNYPMKGVVYEFAAGSLYQAGNSATGQSFNTSVTTPAVSSLLGAYTRFSARALNVGQTNATAATAWTTPATEDYDSYIIGTGFDGVCLTIAYSDNASGGTFTPNSNMTVTGSPSGPNTEAVSFVINVVPAVPGTVKTNSAEGGSNGTAVIVGNSGGGSGSAFSSLTLATGSTAVFDNAQAHSGRLSYNLTPGSGAKAILTYNTPTMAVATRAYIYLTAYPSTATQLVALLWTGGLAADIAIANDGRPLIQDPSGTLNTSMIPIPLNTWLRYELIAIAGSTTSNGYINAAIYLGDSTTNQLYSFVRNNCNTGTGPMSNISYGKASTTGDWATMYVDDIYMSDAATLPDVSPAPAAWFTPMPRVDAVDSNFTGASFSVNASTPTLGGTLVAPDDGRFRLKGGSGWAFGAVFPDTLMYRPSSKYPDTYGYPTSCGAEFNFTGQKFEVYFKHLTGTALIRVKVNGRRLTDLPQTTGASTAGSRYYYLVDLGQTVTNALVTLEFSGMPFGGVVPDVSATVLGGPLPYRSRVIVQGDSLTDGTTQNAGISGGTWLLRLADYMGWDDAWNVAVGGTGYTVAGSAVVFGDAARLDDVTTKNPTKIVVFGGYNDGSTSITTAATSLVASYQTACPGVPIYLVGPWSPIFPADTARTNRDTDVETVAQATGCHFISLITGRVRDMGGNLMTTLTPCIASSADTTAYVGADNIHPTDAGHNHLAKWFYDAFSALP